MNANTIDQLSTLDPESTCPRISMRDGLADARWSPFHTRMRDRFLAKYIKPHFGYYIASQFANRGLPFPVPLLGRDLWVYRAYLMKIDPWKFYDHHILEAYHMARWGQEESALSDILKACLLSFSTEDGGKHGTPQEHLRTVSLKTGVPYLTLEAFEILFFNVIDRRADYMYLQQEVYPHTRLVEFDEDYLKHSRYTDMIKRVGYNHKDMDLTAYMAGLSDHTFLKGLAASDDREANLTRFLMGNGLAMAHVNLLNQRAVGMSRVSNLLAASRQGGREVEEPTMGGIVPLYTAPFKAALRVNQDVMLMQMRRDAGDIEV